ncbi:MAG: COX15/CtaA family protein [Candidatus Dormibacteria bacterium]
MSLAAPSGSGRRPTWILPVLAVGSGVVTYFLIILGSTVRVTESGMGCPGWPLCYGQLGPIDRFHSLLEQSHRYLVALVTVLVVLTAVAAWTFARERRSVLIPATAALGVIAIQIALGAITVVTHNAPFTVALHLLFGLIFLAVTWITVAAVLVPVVPTVGRRLRALGYTTVAMTFLLLISGSMVVDGGATYSCPSWPFCSARGVPGPLVTIQYTHRLTVLVVSIFIVLFVMHVARRWRAIPGARLVADLVGILLLAQIAVGGLVATMSAPAVLQDLHIALAAAIWAAVVALASIGWLAAADAAPGRGAQPSDALRSGGGKSLKMGTDSSTEEG